MLFGCLGVNTSRCDGWRLRTMNDAGEELEDNNESRHSDNKNNTATMAIIGRKSISGSWHYRALRSVHPLSISRPRPSLLPSTSSTCFSSLLVLLPLLWTSAVGALNVSHIHDSVVDIWGAAAQSVSVVCVAGQCLEGYTNITRESLSTHHYLRQTYFR